MGVAKGKHTPSSAQKKSDAKKTSIPIVDVFNEPQEMVDVEVSTPARNPVVVEIEQADDMNEEQISNITSVDEELSPPTMPSRVHETHTQSPPQVEVEIESPLPRRVDDDEQVLPSFFAQDLRTEPQTVKQSQETKILEKAVPQAFVGEIDEITEDVKSEKKKLFGVLFVVLAILFLSIGLLVLYAKKVMVQDGVVSPTPAVMEASMKPVATATPTSSPTATQSGTPSASTSGTLDTLKKKVKIDVLNGTKVSGLAAKEASVLKKAGFLTGTVGNGKPENAGTIVVSTAHVQLAEEVQKVLADFTFTIEKNEKLTTVQVTLGEPKQ